MAGLFDEPLPEAPDVGVEVDLWDMDWHSTPQDFGMAWDWAMAQVQELRAKLAPLVKTLEERLKQTKGRAERQEIKEFLDDTMALPNWLDATYHQAAEAWLEALCDLATERALAAGLPPEQEEEFFTCFGEDSASERPAIEWNYELTYEQIFQLVLKGFLEGDRDQAGVEEGIEEAEEDQAQDDEVMAHFDSVSAIFRRQMQAGHEGGVIFQVRGRPVRVAPDGSANAVEPGYFPISPTGYRSFCGQEVTREVLEAQAREQDKEREATIRRARKALKKKARHDSPGFEETSALIYLSGDLRSCLRGAWLAPDPDWRELLVLALELAKKIKTLPVGQDKQGAWTAEMRRKSIESYAQLIPALQHAVLDYANLEDLARACAAIPEVMFHPPSVLCEAWGITRAPLERGDDDEEAEDLEESEEEPAAEAQPAPMLPPAKKASTKGQQLGLF